MSLNFSTADFTDFTDSNCSDPSRGRGICLLRG